MPCGDLSQIARAVTRLHHFPRLSLASLQSSPLPALEVTGMRLSVRRLADCVAVSLQVTQSLLLSQPCRKLFTLHGNADVLDWL